MKQTSRIIFLLFIAVSLFFACSDPTNIGSNLLEGDKVNIEVSDNINFETYTIEGDSVRSFSPILGSQLRSYLVGTLDDPIFGQSKASLYAEVYPEDTSFTFSSLNPDSLILVLPFDTANIYGSHPEFYQFNVYQIAEEAMLDNTQEYYSNITFPIKDQPIGQLEKTIDPLRRFAVFNPRVDSLEVFPHLRITIDDQDLIDSLTSNSRLYNSNEAFTAFFKGFYLESVQPNEGVLAFNLFDSRAGLELYYTDTAAQVYTFRFTEESVKVVHFEHQYQGAVVEDYIEDKTLGQELVFAQAMSGLETVIEIPEIEELKGQNIIINKAVLEFSIATLEEDIGLEPIEQLLLSTQTEGGSLLVIQDVIGAQSSLEASFGGTVIPGQNGTPARYSLNISDYLQDVLRGTADNRLFLTPLLSAQRASRVVLHGPGSSTHRDQQN